MAGDVDEDRDDVGARPAVGTFGDPDDPTVDRGAVVVAADWRMIAAIVGVFVVVAAALALHRSAGSALTVVVVGIVFGMALDPVVVSLSTRLGISRRLSVLVVVVATTGLLALLLVVMGPRAVSEARSITSDIPGTVEEFYELPLVGGWLEERDAAEEARRFVDELPGRLGEADIEGWIDSLLDGAFAASMVLLVAIAVLIDGERLVALGRRLVPPRSRERADEVGRVLATSIGRYFGGSLAVAALMGIVVLAICLAFSVPLAPLAAVWAMITDLIPQIGGFLGGVLLGTLAITQGPFVFVAVVVLFVLYMNLENHVISPTVIGKAVDVSPAATMLAALFGGAVAGVPGALLGTPLVGAGKELYLRARGIERPEEDDDDSRGGLAETIGAKFRSVVGAVRTIVPGRSGAD